MLESVSVFPCDSIAPTHSTFSDPVNTIPTDSTNVLSLKSTADIEAPTITSVDQATVCPLCGGEGRRLAVVVHIHTKIKKTILIPCVCYTSKIISSEYKLLQHMGDQYILPDKLDTNLRVNFDNLPSNKNIILEGSYDSFLFMIKALLMEHRFDLHKPRILFSRSIDIVHDYHVPQGNEEARHLSATSVFDLAIIVFGAMEVNKAVAPCMAELVGTRLQEKKPTWVYFQEIMTPKSQEYSEGILELFEKHFTKITLKADQSIDKKSVSESKRLASKF